MAATPKPLDRRTLRPAAFLGRSVVIGLDQGDPRLTTDLAPAIARLNAADHFVFFITNEPSVAAGAITQDAMEKRHVRLRLELLELGARIDDLRTCPYHPDATVAAYKRESDWRIPKPGMILDLMRFWPVDLERSFVMGTDADMQAARTAQIAGHRFEGGDLLAFVEDVLGHENPR